MLIVDIEPFPDECNAITIGTATAAANINPISNPSKTLTIQRHFVGDAAAVSARRYLERLKS
jgi:hypothetical protein